MREKVKPTPFVQAWLAGRDRGELEDREALCVPCVNWRRRVTNGSLKKNRRPYLQLDQLILYLLHPGRPRLPGRWFATADGLVYQAATRSRTPGA